MTHQTKRKAQYILLNDRVRIAIIMRIRIKERQIINVLAKEWGGGRCKDKNEKLGLLA